MRSGEILFIGTIAPRLTWFFATPTPVSSPGFAAIERGRVHGYCFFVYEGTKGVIGDLYVENSDTTQDRRHEIEIELLRHSISTLQQSPGLHRVEAQLLIHPTGHLAEPFLEEGFRCYRRTLSRAADR